MIKLKEKVIGYQVECDSCGSLLEFTEKDENYKSGDPDDYTKEITCPVCGDEIMVRNYDGYLVYGVIPIRVREDM